MGAPLNLSVVATLPKLPHDLFGMSSQITPGYGIFVVHDRYSDIVPFFIAFGESVQNVFATVACAPEMVNLAQRGISVDAIERIIVEGKSDMETFLLCTVAELKRYQPHDIVLATGEHSQAFIRSLKQTAEAHDCQDVAQRIMLLDTVLAQTGKSTDGLSANEAQSIYYDAVVRRVYHL